jgi:hypothetical protein
MPTDFINRIKKTKTFLNKTTNWKTTTKIPSNDIMELVNICTDCNIFKWRDYYFEQVTGTPMGSPISPILAELFLQHLENTALPTFHIPWYRRYVDDSLACVQIQDLDNILNDLNNFHPNIKFTVEREVNGRIAFLDADLQRQENGQISRKVYRKPTNTGRYLNFQSYHHRSHKLSVIDSLMYRAITVCDDESLPNEINTIKSCLIRNGYPGRLIDERFKNMKNKLSHNIQQNEDKTPRFILPFAGKLTNRLTTFLRRSLPCKFGYVPGKKIGQLLCNHKDKTKPDQVGVYQIPCSCKTRYFGETGRKLETRLKEHERDELNNKDKDKNKINPKSAVTVHILDNPKHKILYDSASLLEFEPRYFHRTFKEGLYIQKYPNNMNKDSGMKISPIWTTLLLPTLKPP